MRRKPIRHVVLRRCAFDRRDSMGSGTKGSVTTKAKAQERVRKHLDRLTTLQANILRLRYGIEDPSDLPVGDPPKGCSTEIRRKVRAIEKEVLERARGKRPYSKPSSVKDKIIKSLKKKT
jgi:DNA-directed RNA polymerase sigma subunit (sigma70/sigma32)